MNMRKLMLTSQGSYVDPYTKPCWETCQSCGRCTKKGTSACPARDECSGRFDKYGQRHPHPDDYCRCTSGILQWVTKDGRMTQSRMTGDPFKGTVMHETTSSDERDYNQYVDEMREKLNNPDYDPVRYNDGDSSLAWHQKHLGG